MKRVFFSFLVTIFFSCGLIYCFNCREVEAIENIIFYDLNPQKQALKMICKKEAGKDFSNFEILKKSCEMKHQTLLFAMNGGMFLKDYSPQGLYIENGVQKKILDTTQSAYGNFYL